MKTYSKPISLILLAGGSSEENQTFRAALETEEYVFAEATSLFHCLDIAECHHPKAVVLDFSHIENSSLSVIQFFQFLHIPLVLIGDNFSATTIKYLEQKGVFAILEKNADESSLCRNIKKATEAKHQALNSTFDLAHLRSLQKTKLQDLVNLAIGTAVNRTSEMIDCEMQFEPPSFYALSPLILLEKLRNTLGEKLVAVAQLDFSGNLNGSAHMLFSQDAADAIVLSLAGGAEGDELNQMKADIMGEIGNVAINGIVGTFSNTLNYQLGYVVPAYIEGSVEEIFQAMKLRLKSTVILFMSHFKMLQLHVEGDFVLFFQARLLLDLLFRV